MKKLFGGIARQQWRARIETYLIWRITVLRWGIARQQWRARIETAVRLLAKVILKASPASNGGRGLKLRLARLMGRCLWHRPPAMAGAD